MITYLKVFVQWLISIFCGIVTIYGLYFGWRMSFDGSVFFGFLVQMIYFVVFLHFVFKEMRNAGP